MFPAGLQGQGSVPPAAWRPEEPPPAVPTQQHPCCAIGRARDVSQAPGTALPDTPSWGSGNMALLLFQATGRLAPLSQQGLSLVNAISN